MPDLRFAVNLFNFAFWDPLPMLFQYSATVLCMRAIHNSIWRAIQFAGTWLFWPPQKRKLFFLSYYTRTRQQLYTSNLPPLFSACTYCAAHSPFAVHRSLLFTRRCCRQRRVAVAAVVGWLPACLPACLTLIYRYFCCAAHSAALCLLAVCIIWWSRCSLVRSFVRLVRLCAAASAVCVCVCLPLFDSAAAAAVACLPASLSRTHCFASLCFACFAVAVVACAWYSCFSWISVQFSIGDARSTFCSAFTVCSVRDEADFQTVPWVK